MTFFRLDGDYISAIYRRQAASECRRDVCTQLDYFQSLEWMIRIRIRHIVSPTVQLYVQSKETANRSV